MYYASASAGSSFASPPPLDPRHAPIRYAVNRKRVLVVEDNVDSARMLVELLRDMGHEVQYALNGYGALQIVRRFHPDFVLLDLGLPHGMDGFEVARRLRQQPELRSARVIALTGYGSEEHRARSRESGCELHLVKPVSPQALFDLLESRRPQ